MSALVRSLLKVAENSSIQTVSKQLEESVGHSALKVFFKNPLNYKIVNNVVHFHSVLPSVGSKSLKSVGKFLRAGRIVEAFKGTGVESILKKYPDIVKTMSLETKAFPAVKLHEIETKALKFKSELKHVQDLNPENLVKEIEKLPATSTCKTHLNAMTKELSKSKNISGFTLKNIFVGGTVAVTTLGIVKLVKKYQSMINGCMRYERLSDGTLKVCKINEASCHNKSRLEHDNLLCSSNVEIPDVIKNTKCDENYEQPCKNCDSENDNPKSLNPNIEYKCVQNDFFTALADLSIDLVDKTVEATKNVSTEIWNTLYGGIKIIFYIGLAVTSILIIFFGYRFYKQNSSTTTILYEKML